MKIRTLFAVIMTVILVTSTLQAGGALQSPGARGTALRNLMDRGFSDLQSLEVTGERGDARVQHRLGLYFLTGRDPGDFDYLTGRNRGSDEVIPINPEEAAKWFRMAAEQGNLNSQLRLGLLYHDGYGVTRDYAEAAKWLRAPAEEGDLNAQTFIGSVYTRSDDNWQLDYTEAVRWFGLAAGQGSERAIVALAGLYHNGLGVDRDFERAMELYREGSNDSTAQFNIGIMYRQGEGVSVDLEEAAEWIERAAEQGNPQAQHEIGKMYWDGAGLRPNKVTGHMWMGLAVESLTGVESQNWIELSIEILSEMAGAMSPDEVQEANKLRMEWSPTSR